MAAAAGEAIHSGDVRFRATALVQRWSPFAAAAVRCWAAPLAFSLLLQSGQPLMHPSAQGAEAADLAHSPPGSRLLYLAPGLQAIVAAARQCASLAMP
jgi:hypothetical protein